MSRYARLKAGGICVNCGMASVSRRVECSRCRARKAARYHARQKAMTVQPCPTCGRARRGALLGFECRSCAAVRCHRTRREAGALVAGNHLRSEMDGTGASAR